MTKHTIVPHEPWLAARKALLAKEKELTKLREEVARARRDLPWEKVEKDYLFDGPSGKESLADAFGDKSQLVVYHFMFDPSWSEGCKLCSFWADNFERNVVHLAHRDVSLVAVSRAPRDKLVAYQKRMGWTFKWLSSGDTDFNYDFGVSFRSADGHGTYNYVDAKVGGEMPGISVFCRDEAGALYHTYSCYARGLDMTNAAYHYLDLCPKGRDEAGLPWPMAWVERRDSYPVALRAPGKR